MSAKTFGYGVALSRNGAFVSTTLLASLQALALANPMRVRDQIPETS